MLYILIAILMFGLLIAVHEFGHFISAKLLGVRVNEFAIGMGPAIWKRQKGETLYALRAFPIGGFCAMEGEDDASDDPKAFGSKPAWKKFIILVAGSLMNFLTGLLILALLAAQNTRVVVPVVGSFMEGSGLEATGLLPGDRILEINGQAVTTADDATTYLSQAGDRLDLLLERDGQQVALNQVNMPYQTFVINGQEQWKRGITLDTQPVHGLEKLGVVCTQALERAGLYAKLVWTSLGDLLRGAVGVKDLAGPIGIVGMISDVGQNAPSTAVATTIILDFVAFIAVNLAVMNLLPIPALDGGRIFFLVVNGIFTLLTKRKLDPKYEGYINMAGFACLLGLMVFVAFNDVLRLIG